VNPDCRARTAAGRIRDMDQLVSGTVQAGRRSCRGESRTGGGFSEGRRGNSEGEGKEMVISQRRALGRVVARER